MPPNSRPKHRIVGRIALLTSILLTAITTAWAPQASADTWPINDIYGVTLHPDGGYFYYCVYQGSEWPEYAMPDSMKDNVMDVTLNALGGDTEASTNYHACDFNPSGGLTDGVWEEIFYAEGVGGATWCNALNSAGTYCDRADITMSKSEIDQYASNNENEYTHTACHELGHAVGLRHYDGAPPADIGSVNDCMNSGVHDTGNVLWRTYNSHHKGHINAWFVPQ